MTAIGVNLGRRSYDVVIEAGLLTNSGSALSSLTRTGRVLVVADTNVAQLHLDTLTRSMALSGLAVEQIILPPGEATKSWVQLQLLCDRLLELEVERSEVIVALGGGVIGDLTGFAASIVKRGCTLVQVPTTLLAQVDSSVGGKTAINTRAGKNLIGAFYQPALVLIDPATLETLPARDLRAGYAEVVKYGLIDDPDFFEWCERNGETLLSGDVDIRSYAIEKSVTAKARIVGEDERETSGKRALLNLGHTFGHALEAATGFSDRLLHGEAVAAGMAIAFRYSVAKGLCPPGESARLDAHLAAVGLPTRARPITDADGATLVVHMAHDKKRDGGSVPFLLARGIGQTFLERDVALADVASFLDAD